MSEKMVPLSIHELLSRMTKEYSRNQIAFTIHEGFKISRYNDWRKTYAGSLGEEATANLTGEEKYLPIFGEKLEVPLGPAAGPHTQMAQNIISAYIGGARFFELKTVQVMDGEELAKCIARPCIKADDEGYNCEWSTELTVEQAYEEYVKAWCVCKVISVAFGLGDPDGFVFNMSVGYDLEGIKSEKIDRFIEGLKDASDRPIFTETKNALKEFYPEYTELIDDISPRICRSVTLSTLHGCPPDEIERIASYLIKEKELNTFVKCNPTILGYETARALLDKTGFDYVAFDDHHFKEDLQWGDAVAMFRRLQALAQCKGLEFFDKNFERFRNTRIGDIFTFHNRFKGLDTSYNVIRFYREDFLEGVCSTISLQSPHFHFTETLTAELSFTAQRLLSNERVRTCGTCVYFVINKVMEFEIVHIADSNGIIKRFTCSAVTELYFTVLADACVTETFKNILFVSTVKYGSHDFPAESLCGIAEMYFQYLTDIHT